MIYYILGFLSWPFIGFTYVLSHNCYIMFKRYPMLYKNVWEGLTGPFVIIVDFYQRYIDYKNNI